MKLLVFVVALGSIATVRGVDAQATTDRGSGFRWGPGLAFQRGVFGDDDPRVDAELGPTIAVQWCDLRSGAPALMLDSVIWLNRLENPHLPTFG
jgi:hypothetical protein